MKHWIQYKSRIVWVVIFSLLILTFQNCGEQNLSGTIVQGSGQTPLKLTFDVRITGAGAVKILEVVDVGYVEMTKDSDRFAAREKRRPSTIRKKAEDSTPSSVAVRWIFAGRTRQGLRIEHEFPVGQTSFTVEVTDKDQRASKQFSVVWTPSSSCLATISVDQEPVFNAAPLTVRAELQNCTQSSGELSLSFEGQILKQSNNLSLNHVPETAGLYTAKLNFVESGAPKTANLEIDVLDFQTECNIQSLLPSKITASSSNVFQDEALNMKVSPDACDSAVLKEVKYEEGIIDSDGKITWKEIVLPDNLEIHFSGPVLEFSHVFSTAGLVRIRANFFNHLDKKYREVITEDIQVIELLCLDSANGCGPIGNPTM